MIKPTSFDPSIDTVGLDPTLSASLVPQQADPAIPVTGITFGVASMTENSPHDGEMHPDGDEVLYLVSGHARVVFVDDEIADIDVRAGEGLVIPRGLWHRVDIIEPCQIVYLTPGPNNEYRPPAGGKG